MLRIFRPVHEFTHSNTLDRVKRKSQIIIVPDAQRVVLDLTDHICAGNNFHVTALIKPSDCQPRKLWVQYVSITQKATSCTKLTYVFLDGTKQFYLIYKFPLPSLEKRDLTTLEALQISIHFACPELYQVIYSICKSVERMTVSRVTKVESNVNPNCAFSWILMNISCQQFTWNCFEHNDDKFRDIKLKIFRTRKYKQGCGLTINMTRKDLFFSRERVSFYKIAYRKIKVDHGSSIEQDPRDHVHLYRGTIYTFSKATKGSLRHWEGAQAICKEAGGHLITFNNKHELNIFKFGIIFSSLSKVSFHIYLMEPVFIGLKYSFVSNTTENIIFTMGCVCRVNGCKRRESGVCTHVLYMHTPW